VVLSPCDAEEFPFFLNSVSLLLHQLLLLSNEHKGYNYWKLHKKALDLNTKMYGYIWQKCGNSLIAILKIKIMA
jgi:hypothetical protein